MEHEDLPYDEDTWHEQWLDYCYVTGISTTEFGFSSYLCMIIADLEEKVEQLGNKTKDN